MFGALNLQLGLGGGQGRGVPPVPGALRGTMRTGFGAGGTLTVARELAGEAGGIGFAAAGGVAVTRALVGNAATGFGASGALAVTRAIAGGAGIGSAASADLTAVAPWLLASGAWNDLGEWDDTATWPAAAFEPSDITATYEGTYFDFSDTSKVFQDAAKTNAVTTDEQIVRAAVPVATATSSADLTAGSDTIAPLWKTSGGLSWVQLDGTDDAMTGLLGFEVTATSYLAVAVGRGDVPGVVLLTGFDFNGGIDYVVPQTVSTSNVRGNFKSTGGNVATSTITWNENTQAVMELLTRDGSGNCSFSFNGGTPVTVGSVFAPATNYGAASLRLSRQANQSLNYRVYAIWASSTTPSTEHRTALREWMAAKAGVTL